MGITGELVRNVFSKRLSIQRHEKRGKSNSAERKKWSISVRSYLCGDENNNSNSSFAAADEDSVSVSVSVNLANPNSSFRSNMATNYSTCTNAAEDQEDQDSASEATVNQPLHEEDNSKVDHDEKFRRNQKEINSTCKLFKQEDAALIIQTAFRSFQARRATASNEEAKREDEASIGGTSIEVQTGGNSSDIFSLKEESFDVCHSTRNRARPQVLKLQDDWDDSTVSSTKSKMRIQNRLEAATRRERALAYAFSQQLRICSKKKQSSCDDTNMGWNWLERWMAARQPKNESMIEDEIVVDNYNNEKPVLVAKKRLMDAGAGLIEEKESCGSNEVSSSQFEVNINNIINVPSRPSIPRTRSKLIRNLSKQNLSVSTH